MFDTARACAGVCPGRGGFVPSGSGVCYVGVAASVCGITRARCVLSCNYVRKLACCGGFLPSGVYRSDAWRYGLPRLS
jgi:hypothetical protein